MPALFLRPSNVIAAINRAFAAQAVVMATPEIAVIVNLAASLFATCMKFMHCAPDLSAQ
jgi:hypothetical protein